MMPSLSVVVVFLFTVNTASALGSCNGRCDTVFDSNFMCQCNSHCERFGDCCADYQELCVDGGSSTSCDLSCIAQKLWDADINRMPSSDLTINYQSQTVSSGSFDDCAAPLFSSVNEVNFQKPTYAGFITLLDNFIASTSVVEDITAAEWAEVDSFMAAILSTSVMDEAYNYLNSLGVVTSTSHFRDIVMELWFNLYSRSNGGIINSSGFEHAMVGEHSSSSVSGFHSWIQFYLEEKARRLNYLGWISKQEPLVVGAKFTWNGKLKTKGSFFIGTSPEFDLAIYSICALTRPNAICYFDMNGQSYGIQTWDIAHKAGTQIGSAYPV